MVKIGKHNRYEAVVIGASAGGTSALREILPSLPEGFSLPVVVVQHLHPSSRDDMPALYKNQCRLRVKQADEKEAVAGGCVYFAPANYHLLIEDDRTFSLSVDAPVNFSRPSIDVLFESAADVYGAGLIGVVLTGANNDGSAGLRKIKAAGATVIVQDPDTAECSSMPAAAIAATTVDYILDIKDIANVIIRLAMT
ncbi:protein-glutamate methylesterase CheB [Candidatus Magnetobacterium bavaricum]|uniref:protein-glutamate methylesterase n=1 Tax=Candidatus Magnetobacterium bavaricum TaxID=29290 RepID=A0A0F3H1N6_9BACT|nr:protein-glutamate methylesterase CheB [Candidatus Magnetobacterium bavaricum]